MKTNWIKQTLTIAGAAVMLAAAGFAEAGDVTAKIDFPFYVRGVAMAPGSYKLLFTEGRGGMPVFRVRDSKSGRMVFLTVQSSGLVGKSQDPRPRLVFTCGAEACWIDEVWTGGESYYHTYKGKAARPEKTRVATVYFDSKAGN